VITDINSI